MPIPWTDWQFWVVSAIFVIAAGYLLRGVVGRLWHRRTAAARGRRATLTISAKARTDR
jgi:hypothetical protein